MPFVIALTIGLFSHLTVDKDFPENVRTGSYIVFTILALIYFFTRIIF